MTPWAQQVQAYEARQTSEAQSASIAPFATKVEHPRRDLETIGNEWSRTLFDGPFYLSHAPSPDLPATSLVFVQSRDGNTGTKRPSALGAGAADLHLIYEGLSRVAADAVLAGATTVRGGQFVFSTWHPELVALRATLGLPRHPIQIVATRKGVRLEDGLLFNVPGLRVLLITVARAMDVMHDALNARPWIAPMVMTSADDLPDVFRRIRQLGVRRISCVGGRTLARQLIDAQLIQDLYLTTGAKDGGEPGTPLYPGALAGDLVVRKIGSGANAGVVFEHTRLT